MTPFKLIFKLKLVFVILRQELSLISSIEPSDVAAILNVSGGRSVR